MDIEGGPGKRETIKYEGKMFAVVEKKISINGKDITLEVGRRAPGTRLILDAGDGSLLLTKEFRPELNRYDYRLPGGKVFDSLSEYNTALQAGEDLTTHIETAARKEAKEEVGIDYGEFKAFHKSVAGLTVEWDLHYFVVTNFSQSTQELGEHEDIEVVRVSKEDAKKMCLDGSIDEERSALILLRYLSA